jgi:hypothetical protein
VTATTTRPGLITIVTGPPPPQWTHVLGIDPGPSTGIAWLNLGSWPSDGAWARAMQCDAATAPWLLTQILDDLEAQGLTGHARGGIEGFAPGRGAGAAKHGSFVNRQVEELAGICAGYGVPLTARYPVVVKTWATDRRLAAAGLLGITAKAPDARDSCRHALYTACQECSWPDPLSRKARHE